MKLKQKRTTLSVALVLTLWAVVSCSRGETVRKYKDKEKETAPASGKVTTPDAGSAPQRAHFKWVTPGGWTEEKKSPGFRLAAFSIKSNIQTRETVSQCTIIPLQGEAGGLKANVERWLSQISGKAAPPAGAVDKLLQAQEKFLAGSQFPGVIIDFTAVTPNPTDITILAGVITVNGNSIFIKMTGEKSQLVENKEKFKALCQSFSL